MDSWKNSAQANEPREMTEANLGELWRSLRRRWRLLLGVSLGVVAVTMSVLAVIPPVFESESVLRVRSEDKGSGMSGMLGDLLPMGSLPSLPGLGDADVETEMGVLRSRRIAEAVADSVGLHVELSRPWRQQRSRYLEIHESGSDAVRGVYTLRREDDGSYTVRASRTGGPVQLPQRVEIGQPFQVANVTMRLAPELSADPPAQVRFRIRPYQRMIRKLRKDLKVSRQEGRSKLIDVAYRHRDPYIAAGVVNGVVERFLEYSRSSEKQESQREVAILREQVAAYRNELLQAEQRLQVYQEQERIIAPEEQATQHVKRIAEIQAKHDAMEVERAALARLIAQVGQQQSAGGGGPAPYRQLATFPSFISNRAVQDVLQALIELENERAELLGPKMRTEQNQDVRSVQNRINELEGQLFALGSNYLNGLDNQIGSTGAALARFGRELETIPAVEVEYARRLRDRKLVSEVYVLLEAQLREAEVKEALDDSSVRVLDTGIVADRPAFPRPTISLVLATMLGLMVGLFTVVGSEMMNSSVRSRRDAEQAAFGVPVLGVIPRLRPGRASGPDDSRRIGIGRLAFGGRIAAPGNALITRRDPWHPVSESYRSLAAGLFRNREVAPRVLVVTSALAGEGKSTVAANLAITLARSGTRTVLLDADLRQGSLASVFGVAAEPGWPRCATGGMPVEEVVHDLEVGGAGQRLHLLPAGTLSVHPSELLGTDGLRGLLRELQDRYDAVIVDTPPLLAAYDAAVLAGMADGTLLVARSGATDREALERAAVELRHANARLVGMVLNDLEERNPVYAARQNGASHHEVAGRSN